MSPHANLLELTPDALMALANPGFVKRAQKDLAAGMAPTLTHEADGTLQALFEDGTITSIAPRHSLKEARCSCPASTMCRHRVALVLSYQATQSCVVEVAWDPALFTDEMVSGHFSQKVIEQARKQALSFPVATLSHSEGVPHVRLPMCNVRFFSRNNLAHARCDCVSGHGCTHIVLAVWACRLAQREHPDLTEVTLKIPPFGCRDETQPHQVFQADTLALRIDIQSFLWDIWREGSSQPLLALDARYQRLQQRITQQSWTWVGAALEQIWEILQAQATRSSRFDIVELLEQISQLWARLHASLQADRQTDTHLHTKIPASQILGIGQLGEVALDQLRLISLGAQMWRDDQDEGVEIVFADSDTHTLSVFSRSWPSNTAGELLKRRVAGSTLGVLAAGQLVTKSAKRRANGRLELGGTSRQTSAMPLSPHSWDDLSPPLKFAQLEALEQYLCDRPPASVLPSQSGSSFHVINLNELALTDWAWDAARQTLFAQWQSVEGTEMRAFLPYQQQTPGAVDALVRALKGEWGGLRYIAGRVWLTQGAIGLRPISLLTDQRAVILALEPVHPQQLALRTSSWTGDARFELLNEMQSTLGQLLRLGLRHASPAQRSRLTLQAEKLQEAGFPEAARLAYAMFASDANRDELATVSMLCLLLQALMA
ncbi:MAG: hypothetical protein WAO71_00760 [Gallionella sp.]